MSEFSDSVNRFKKYHRGQIVTEHPVTLKDNSFLMRQWAPGAQERWLMGDFNNWQKYNNPFRKLEFGKWEITLGPTGHGKKLVCTFT